jgi:hypothetical protein
MPDRSIVNDPYDLLGVSTLATQDEVWLAYPRAMRARPSDRPALTQAQEDLRQPHKRLAVDMLLAVPPPSDAEIESMLDQHAELPPLVDNDLIAILAIAPSLELDHVPVSLEFRSDLDDEPIVVLEFDP